RALRSLLGSYEQLDQGELPGTDSECRRRIDAPSQEVPTPRGSDQPRLRVPRDRPPLSGLVKHEAAIDGLRLRLRTARHTPIADGAGHRDAIVRRRAQEETKPHYRPI